MESIDPAGPRSLAGQLRTALTGPDRPPVTAGARSGSRTRGYAVPLALFAIAGLGLAAFAYLQDNRHISGTLAGVLALGSVLPIALAGVFHRPLTGWRIAFLMQFAGVFGAVSTEPWPWNPVQSLGFLAVLFAVGARGQSGVTGWVTALSLGPVFLYAPEANAWGAATGVLAVALAGELVGRRRQNRRELAAQEEVSERERARRAVLEERARIAREMHDVVAHHMSMIAVQAETAPYRLDGLPEPALAELATIATAARTALTDMRRLLGVLRSDTEETALAPQPGLADLPGLVATARRAGLTVTLDGAPPAPDTTEGADGVPGGADGVPGAVGLAAYRIVQEALANAARHAPDGPVRVVVHAAADRLDVTVHGGPSTPAPIDGPTSGHGLIGMRERAALLGGTLSAGPDGADGYTVTATLPYEGGRPS